MRVITALPSLTVRRISGKRISPCSLSPGERAVIAISTGVDSASGHTTLALCGVYDGHGGKEAARYLKNYLHSSVAAQLGIEPSASAKASAETAASAAFTSFAASAKFEEGTTASCALSSRWRADLLMLRAWR